MLEDARSRGGRRRLSEAENVCAETGAAEVLHLASGAQTGLTIISALEEVVVEEGEACTIMNTSDQLMVQYGTHLLWPRLYRFVQHGILKKTNVDGRSLVKLLRTERTRKSKRKTIQGNLLYFIKNISKYVIFV